jgi:hypothetical protein
MGLRATEASGASLTLLAMTWWRYDWEQGSTNSVAEIPGSMFSRVRPLATLRVTRY